MKGPSIHWNTFNELEILGLKEVGILLHYYYDANPNNVPNLVDNIHFLNHV